MQQIQLFLDVVELESFAAVARKHNIDPSSVSRTVAAMESELGARLFQRTTRSVQLTDAGKSFSQRLSRMNDEWCLAKDELSGETSTLSGSLRFTCSVAFGHECMLPLLPKFQSQHPDLELDCMFTDTNVDLIAEGVDLAIRLAPALDSTHVGRRLFSTSYHVVASPAYLKSAGNIISPEDLKHQACLRYSLPQLKSHWVFRKNGVEQKVPVNGKLSMSNPLVLRESARMGLGVALLADWVVKKDLEADRLIRLFSEFEVTASDFNTAAWLLYPSRRYVPEKVRAFMAFLEASLPS